MILVEDLMLELLMEYEVNVNAVFPSVIKPLPISDIITGIKDCSVILVLEESPKNFKGNISCPHTNKQW